jgi:N-acetylneuraminic acid mutarotase
MPSTWKLLGTVALAALFVLFGSGPHAARADAKWTTMAPMPTARTGLAVGVVDRVLYAVGGFGTDDVALNTVEAYDRTTNTWTTKAPMPTARADLAVGVVNNVLYAIGGINTRSSSPPSYGGLATVEAYDPATDTWVTKAPMPTARHLLTVGVVNNVIFAIGGGGEYMSLPMAMTTVEAYDPATDTWVTKAPMPRAHFMGLASDVVDNVVYVVAGDSTVLAYDPASDTWATKASEPGVTLMPPLSCARATVPRQYPSVGVVNNVLYVVGGYAWIRGCVPGVVFATVTAYDPATDTWTTNTPMPTARGNLGVGVVNGVLYAIGGWNENGVLATVEAYAHPSVRGITKRHGCDDSSDGRGDRPPSRGHARC